MTENTVCCCREHIKLSNDAAREGMVLLKNENGTLPLSRGEKVALFGKGSIAYVKGGGGSGDVYTKYVRSIYDGFMIMEAEGRVCVNERVSEFYRDFIIDEVVRGRDVMGKNAVPEPRTSPVFAKNAANESDTAIITISRYSLEGDDRKAEGDYYLSENEKLLISSVCDSFKKVILVLNVGSVVDTSYFINDDRISAVLLAWQGGTEGGLAVAEALCGVYSPSGKLVDTFAKSLEDYPCTAHFYDSEDYVEYSEDIYVGYRYFETIPGAKEKVNYPFGFGLSYTKFNIFNVKAERDGDEIKVYAMVKNVGNFEGKEVVQLYFSAPQGVLGKPARELIAFYKTKKLNPGELEKICLTFKISNMASFDDLGKIEKSAYLLEKGEYNFYIGNNVRDAEKIDFSYNLEENVIVERLTSRCAPCNLKERMLANGEFEALPQKEIERGYIHAKNSTAKAPDRLMPFNEVKSDADIDSFIAQYTGEELCDFMGGSDNVGVTNTLCFSEQKRLGVPPVTTADGPAGLRLDYWHGIETTAWPCATQLACSWNTDILKEVGAAAARELRENGIFVWLAPALNIHRTPLCGRNFEYFSEDPLISGKMAAAEVEGIQSEGISACIKHFACNNHETNRLQGDSRVSERALREIYLKGFEICVKEASPISLMSSYNILNGIHASESYDLLTGILRGEWGFDGMITTDWGIKNNPVHEVLAGNDMKMHKGYPDDLLAALNSGELTRGDLEACARRILKAYRKLV